MANEKSLAERRSAYEPEDSSVPRHQSAELAIEQCRPLAKPKVAAVEPVRTLHTVASRSLPNRKLGNLIDDNRPQWRIGRDDQKHHREYAR